MPTKKSNNMIFTLSEVVKKAYELLEEVRSENNLLNEQDTTVVKRLISENGKFLFNRAKQQNRPDGTFMRIAWQAFLEADKEKQLRMHAIANLTLHVAAVHLVSDKMFELKEDLQEAR